MDSQKRSVDFTELASPPALDESQIAVESKTVQVDFNGKKVDIYVENVVKDGEQPTQSVLFLHGMKFSSKNWLDIKSVHHVAQWGYRAVAVDLPGYGKSKAGALEPGSNHGQFLEHLIKVLGLDKPVIVSPSMSGMFSLPFLFNEPEKSVDKCKGYVPVAPVYTEKFVDKYPQSELRTLMVIGSNDTVFPHCVENLMKLPSATHAPIADAGHACYLDNPDAFHKLIFHFLNQLKL